MIGFDLETTGIDVENDRAVTATLIRATPDGHTDVRNWLIDPGVEIPAQAAEIHGVTTEHAREHGMPPARAFEEITNLLHQWWIPETPLVAYNGSFDLSMTDREMARHLGPDVGVSLVNRYLIDPLVIDRKQSRRKGSRKLGPTCEFYGIPLGENAHNSEADTLATLKLAFKLAVAYPGSVGYLPLPTLHDLQREWHAAWGTRMRAWLMGEALKLDRAWSSGNQRFVQGKFEQLGITEDPSEESVARCVAGTRERAEDFLSSSLNWPMKARETLTQDAVPA